KSKVKETVFNKDWWSGKWEGVKGWAQEKWNGAVSVWESIKSKVKETVFNKDWWSNKWEGVKSIKFILIQCVNTRLKKRRSDNP
ncbi:hypothetical protein MOD16_16345, partial [Bacillus atrophaeus]